MQWTATPQGNSPGEHFGGGRKGVVNVLFFFPGRVHAEPEFAIPVVSGRDVLVHGRLPPARAGHGTAAAVHRRVVQAGAAGQGPVLAGAHAAASREQRPGERRVRQPGQGHLRGGRPAAESVQDLREDVRPAVDIEDAPEDAQRGEAVPVPGLQQELQPGREPDGPREDALGGEAVPVPDLRQEVLPEQLRDNAHEDTQRGAAV